MLHIAYLALNVPLFLSPWHEFVVCNYNKTSTLMHALMLSLSVILKGLFEQVSSAHTRSSPWSWFMPQISPHIFGSLSHFLKGDVLCYNIFSYKSLISRLICPLKFKKWFKKIIPDKDIVERYLCNLSLTLSLCVTL